jgi:serine/threonine protein kinase
MMCGGCFGSSFGSSAVTSQRESSGTEHRLETEGEPHPAPSLLEGSAATRQTAQHGSSLAVAQAGRASFPRQQASSSLAAELRARWACGDRPGALDLLAECDPRQLSQDELLDLVYEQIFQRYAAGLDSDLEPLCLRFPELAGSFRRMASVHRAMHQVRPHAPEAGAWPLPGDVWKHYYLIEELGAGGFARVYLAADTTLGWRLVVLKLSQSLANEGEALARLRHENIVPVLSAIPPQPPELGALCMPYMGRATLKAVMDRLHTPDGLPRRARALLEAMDAINREGEDAQAASSGGEGLGGAPPRTESELPTAPPDPMLLRASYVDGVVHLGAQLAAALAAAHDANICHFDIKPSNILLAPGGKPMLLDFNLASKQGRPVGGTPRYMAPEQLEALLAGDAPSPLGPAADVYSLGVVLYELLTGRHPQEDGPLLGSQTASRGAESKYRQTPPPLSSLNRQVDARVAKILHQALAVDPARRPTAAQLAVRLRGALTRPARTTRWVLRHRLLAAVASLGLLCVAVAAGTAWKRLPPAAEQAYQQGLACVQASDLAGAEAALQECVKHDPTRAVAWFLLGRVHQRQGQWGAAVKDYERARACADDAWLDACLGSAILGDRGPSQTALGYLRDAHRKGLNTPGLYNNLGLACHKRALLEEAQLWLNLAVERQPDLQVARVNRAWLARSLAFRENRPLPAEAVADIELAVALGPPSVQLYVMAAVFQVAAQPEGEPAPPLAIERLREALRHSQDAKLPYYSPCLVSLQPTLPPELVGTGEAWPRHVQRVADPLPRLRLEEEARLLARRLAER